MYLQKNIFPCINFITSEHRGSPDSPLWVNKRFEICIGYYTINVDIITVRHDCDDQLVSF